MEAFSFAELVSVAHCSELISTEKKTDNDDISSQISDQIFEFCDHELFRETLQNSEEVTSCSNCCYEENSSYPQSLSLPQDIVENFTPYQANNNANINTNTNNNMSSIVFDSREEIENDISASIDFSVPPPLILGQNAQQDQFGFASAVQPQQQIIPGFASYPAGDPIIPLMPSVFEDDCLSSAVPSYLPMNPSSPTCSFLGPAMGPYLPALSANGSGLFAGSLLMASELQSQELDYQGDNGGGIFCTDSMQRVFNPGEIQALGTESQQLIGGAGNSNSLATDIPNMGDQTFKVGKLSAEQRKEKIHRYMKKKNERNFSKKIKYACRKTLADSRPRVRGRFAKNDDFEETLRAASSNHEEDDEEEVIVKQEDDMVDSSDIFAHISGVNSFKCNYPIQSWI